VLVPAAWRAGARVPVTGRRRSTGAGRGQGRGGRGRGPGTGRRTGAGVGARGAQSAVEMAVAA